ncbi:MAG: hypothetical protein ACRAVC_04815 [Trichormus sp.]
MFNLLLTTIPQNEKGKHTGAIPAFQQSYELVTHDSLFLNFDFYFPSRRLRLSAVPQGLHNTNSPK